MNEDRQLALHGIAIVSGVGLHADGGLEVALVVLGDCGELRTLPCVLVAHAAAGNDRHRNAGASESPVVHYRQDKAAPREEARRRAQREWEKKPGRKRVLKVVKRR